PFLRLLRRTPSSPRFPYTTLFRSGHGTLVAAGMQTAGRGRRGRSFASPEGAGLYLSVIVKTGLPMQDAALTTCAAAVAVRRAVKDRKSTRLNSSHVSISYAVFCLK